MLLLTNWIDDLNKKTFSFLLWTIFLLSYWKKANSTRGFLRRNLRRCPATVKEQPYKTYVRPTLEYASTVWDPHHTDLSDQVDMVQRCAARFVKADFHQRHSVTKMLEDLKGQTLRERRAHNKVTMVYRIVHGLVAIPCGPRYFIPSRSGFLQHHTAGYQHWFRPSAICLWNHLPDTVVTATSLDQLQGRLSSLQLC